MSTYVTLMCMGGLAQRLARCAEHHDRDRKEYRAVRSAGLIFSGEFIWELLIERLIG